MDLSTTTFIDKVLSVLEHSNDGENLTPNHLRFIEAITNEGEETLTNEETQLLDQLYQSTLDGTYQKPWLCDIEHITNDHNGFVYFKGISVEHFSFNLISADRLIPMVKDLQEKCLKAESLGIPISAGIILNHRWFNAIESPFDPITFFISHYRPIYQDGTKIVIHTKYNRLEKYQVTHSYLTFDTITKEVSEQQMDTKDICDFRYWAEKQNLKSIVLDDTQEIKEWIDQNNFPVWVLNPKAYWTFALNSMKNRNLTEVPESTYDHFLECLPPLKMNYLFEGKIWFINSEPYNHTDNGTNYYAFTKWEGKYYGKMIELYTSKI